MSFLLGPTKDMGLKPFGLRQAMGLPRGRRVRAQKEEEEEEEDPVS